MTSISGSNPSANRVPVLASSIVTDVFSCSNFSLSALTSSYRMLKQDQDIHTITLSFLSLSHGA